jgi:nitrite reductase (NADH) large subunit
MRTVKSCVGSTWCRYGVQDSVAFAVMIENRYKGIRAPHKLKSAVSGCIRECAEAQSKDFGLIATEKGWNLYVCGNGGAQPRHADLLASDLDDAWVVKYLDRFVMYYICTADRLTRTSKWIGELEGGIDYLREVIIDDKLGICEQLERDMQRLVETYRCEWADVVRDPAKRERFRHFAHAKAPDPSVAWLEERGQRRPADWPLAGLKPKGRERHLPVLQRRWVRVARVEDVPADAGIAVDYGGAQIAVYNFAFRGEWYACQNMCPHMRDMVLARGTIGDQQGVPKVACPQHKKTFSLRTGECLSDEGYAIQTFPVKVEAGWVYLELPEEGHMQAQLESASADCTRAGSSEPVAAQ